MDAETKKLLWFAGSGEVLLFKRKDSNKNVRKNEIYSQQCCLSLA